MSIGLQPASVQGTPTQPSGKKREIHASWLEPHANLYSLKDRVIFTAGEHKGRLYTKQDLANMVRAFEPTLNQIKPRIKLGHDEAQSYARLAFSKLGTKPDEYSVGMPALGYVDNVRLNSEYTDRNGRKHEAGTEVLADFVNLDEGLYRDLMALRYPERSAEVIRNYQDKEQPGTVWPTVLQNVAFLGDELPAVRGMAPLVERNTADRTDVELEVVTFRFSEGDEMPVDTPPGVPGKQVMTPEEMTAKIEMLLAAVEALQKSRKEPDGDEPMAEAVKPEPGPGTKAPATENNTAATVPATPAMPMAQTPPPVAPPAAGKEKEGATTVHIHDERLLALETKLAESERKRLELESQFVKSQSDLLLKQQKQEAETFAENLCKPENMRVPAALKGEVARIYQNAPDVQKFSDTGKSFKEELAALLGKLPLLAKPAEFQQRGLTLVPRDVDSGHSEVVKFAEDKAREMAKDTGLPFAQCLYRVGQSDEMSAEKLAIALGYTGNSGTAGV